MSDVVSGKAWLELLESGDNVSLAAGRLRDLVLRFDVSEFQQPLNCSMGDARFLTVFEVRFRVE